jgi:hypothetical protein
LHTVLSVPEQPQVPLHPSLPVHAPPTELASVVHPPHAFLAVGALHTKALLLQPVTVPLQLDAAVQACPVGSPQSTG